MMTPMPRGHRARFVRDFARYFGGASVPKAPPPPPPPKIEDPNVQDAAAKERRRMRGAKGRGSTLLAGDTLGAPSTLGGTPAA